MKPISQIIKEGEEEFDKKFGIYWSKDNKGNVRGVFAEDPTRIIILNADSIKFHNRTQAKDILEGVIKMCDGMKKKIELQNQGTEYEYPKNCGCIAEEGSCSQCVDYEFNSALTQVIEKLKEEISNL